MSVFPVSLFCPGVARIAVEADSSPRAEGRHTEPNRLLVWLRNAYANHVTGALGPTPGAPQDISLPDPGHEVVNLIEFAAAVLPNPRGNGDLRRTSAGKPDHTHRCGTDRLRVSGGCSASPGYEAPFAGNIAITRNCGDKGAVSELFIPVG
jgi:hypothetical protein